MFNNINSLNDTAILAIGVQTISSNNIEYILMKQNQISYRFKSENKFEQLTFPGDSISIKDLKKAIATIKNLGKI